jgi:hypothetical protein
MVEGDDTLSGATGEVGRGALCMEVVGRPAEPTGAVIRALATVISGILAMAREAIRERWQLAFAKH